MVPGQLLAARNRAATSQTPGWIDAARQFGILAGVRSPLHGSDHESRSLNGFKTFTAGPCASSGRLTVEPHAFDETGQWNCGFGHFRNPNQLGLGAYQDLATRRNSKPILRQRSPKGLSAVEISQL